MLQEQTIIELQISITAEITTAPFSSFTKIVENLRKLINNILILRLTKLIKARARIILL